MSIRFKKTMFALCAIIMIYYQSITAEANTVDTKTVDIMAAEAKLESLKMTETKTAEIKTAEIKTVSASDLLKASDRSRGAAASTLGLSWIADISSIENDETNEVRYNIKVLGDDALAQVIAPVRQKGELILFNDRTLWFFKPGLKKPVSLSARQKLSGQAANGDIASTQYNRDYDGELVGEETVFTQNCWKLKLKAKNKKTTYDKIIYWISKKENLAVRADFLTLSGEVFKSAEFKYANMITVKAGTFPFISEMKITDSYNSKNITVIKYQAPHEEAHAKMIFNINNIIR